MRILSTDLYPLIREWGADLAAIAQLHSMDEGKFLTWCSERKAGMFGVVTGDAGNFWKRGWLRSEEIRARPKDLAKRFSEPTRFMTDDREIGAAWIEPNETQAIFEPVFHPFRILPAYQITSRLDVRWAASSSLSSSFSAHHAQSVSEVQTAIEQGAMLPLADKANGIADLAILLEPLYWPWITSRFIGRSFTNSDELDGLRESHRSRMLDVLRRLGLEHLRETHEQLRHEALSIDRNEKLYLLLRASNWDTRENVRDHIGLALWFRHMAEVIRRGAEEAHQTELPEEDEGYGIWHKGGRERIYGSSRPLDYPSYYRKDLLQLVGLDASIRVKWYVEGQTELGFLYEELGGPRDSQVEIANRKGKFSGAPAVDLFDELRQDLKAERFTMVSADRDVAENYASVQRMAREDLIVGFVSINDPDFESANFSVEELVEAAIRYDATHPEHPTDSSDLLRSSDWSAVSSGRDFDEKYQEFHAGTRRPLKGERWGKTLAELFGAQLRSDGTERPVQVAIRMARLSPVVVHRFQLEHYKVDPTTLENVERDSNNPA